MKPLYASGLVALALALTACQAMPLLQPAGSVQVAQRYEIRGVADFGDRQVQIAPTTLTSLATVTLLNASNQTVATTRTDAAGSFSLAPAASFTPAAGDVFYLDAYKGARNNQVGGDVARLRTILQWTANGWTSTSGATVVINSLTTAVCTIQGLNAGTIAASVTLGTVSGSTVSSGNGTLASNWSAVNTLVRDLLAKDQDPLARISLVSGSYRALPNLAQPLVLENFQTGTYTDTALNATGGLILAGPRPTANDPASEIDCFQAAGVAPNTAGAITTDGTYLYIKSWGSYGPDTALNRTIKRIGTGFNGTVRGANYGTLGSAVPANGISLAYVAGYVYATMGGNSTQLYQVSTTTGVSSLLDLPVSLMDYSTGAPSGGHPQITTDGTYVYNLAWGIDGALGSGYTVQILDPRQGMQRVRKVTIDTSAYYTDGAYCDGTYLYPQEWNGGTSARVRRYRLSDGVREAEWTFNRINDWSLGPLTYNPTVNNPIGCAWDPYNRVFWTGNLNNEKIHLLRGGNYIPTGTWQSAVLDSGSGTPLYGRLAWKADLQGADGLTFQVRSAGTVGALSSATWYGPTSTTDRYTTSGTALNPIHAKQRYLQVRATLSSANLLTTPMLDRLSLEVLP